jgi:phosphatidylglycerol lysyltransferase
MPTPSANTELQLTLDLVLQFGWNATAYQIVNPGIQRWFSSAHDAVVGYVEHYGVRVVAGAPVCRTSKLAGIVQEFEADSAPRNVCYFGAEQRMIEALPCDASHTQIVLGAQPAWKPADWNSMLSDHASLRAQLHRARNKGVAIERWENDLAAEHPELQRCLTEWLRTRGLPPLHFLVEPQTLSRLFNRMVFVARHHERVVGFLVASPIPLRHGWLIEQNIRGRDAPNGTSELLIDTAIRAMAEEGARFVTLGLSPISRHAALLKEKNPPGLQFVLDMVRAYGRRFYNFEGLDNFKAKFHAPHWETVYAISNESRMSLRTLYATAAAFAGENPLRMLARGMRR